MRTTSAHLDDIPGSLPDGHIPDSLALDQLADWAIDAFKELRAEAFTAHAIWRDLFAWTSTYRTLVGRETIIEQLSKYRQQSRAGTCARTLTPVRKVSVQSLCSWVDVDFEFALQKVGSEAVGRGTVSATIDAHGERRIWLVRTWLDHFAGHGNPDAPSLNPAPSSLEDHEKPFLSAEPEMYDTVIIGGGQAGLSVAGRLQALGINYLVLEKHSTLGDIWRTRYASLRWHTPKEYGNLPFGRMFADDVPELVPTAAIGEAHSSWARRYSINARTNCTVESATFDGKVWTVSTTTNGSVQTLRAKDLVLAIGPGSTNPSLPAWATPEAVKQSEFQGTVVHAKDYKSCEEWTGKHARGVTVGTANTGHDIAEDMANAGMTTTMLQRGSTFVIPGEWLCAAEGAHYNTTMSNVTADQEQFTMPLKLVRQIINTNVHAGIKAHPERFDKLEQAGFKLDRFGDLYTNIFTRFGGHYVDTGASARIAAGEINMESTPARKLSRNGIELENGRLLECDLIVLATGYQHDFRKDAARIVGDVVADQMDDFFGLDNEGEIRGYAKYAGHPHLYYHGGDTRSSRFMSRFVALQIQASMLAGEKNGQACDRTLQPNSLRDSGIKPI